MSLPKDLVYFVRDGDYNEELRYSLRSVAKNLAHERIWIVGHTPKWVRKVWSIDGNLKGGKWLNVLDNLRIISEQVDADSFVVMNDDFFVTRPTSSLPPLYRGSLTEHLTHVKGHGSWRDSLITTGRVLRDLGYSEPLSYELHVPVVMEREKLRRVVEIAQDTTGTPPQWRTLYGNIWGVGGDLAKDGKVTYRRLGFPEGAFESSDETSFGEVLRPKMHALFPDPCRYEDQGGATIARVNRAGEASMAIFRTTVYPALMVRIYDRQFKFVGGRLRVKDEDVAVVEDFISQHPQYHIRRVATDPAPTPVSGEATDQPTAVPNSLKPTLGELRKALKAWGLPVEGTRDQLEDRLAAAYEGSA